MIASPTDALSHADFYAGCKAWSQHLPLFANETSPAAANASTWRWPRPS